MQDSTFLPAMRTNPQIAFLRVEMVPDYLRNLPSYLSLLLRSYTHCKQ